MFFVQAKAALSDFKVLQKLRAAAAGFSEACLGETIKKKGSFLADIS
jgi:hypothetical protein